jgi:hypothetical protein
LDASGRWVTNAKSQSVTTIDGLDSGELFIESAVFVKNLNAMAAYVEVAKKP